MKQFYFSFPGSAQLIFNAIKSVEYTLCNQTVVIPCFVNNVETKNITELYVRWKFKGENIFIFDGNQRMSKPSSNFSSAEIAPSELLRGIASLKMAKSDAVLGNYTCEVTELSREGETIIELKYRVGKTSIKFPCYFFCSNMILLKEGKMGLGTSLNQKAYY